MRSRGVGVSILLPVLLLSALLSAAFASHALAAGGISGQVTASCPSSGTPLLGVTVDAYQVGSDDLVGTGVTDASGNYTISALPAGDYTVTVLTPLGYTTAANDAPATVLDAQSTTSNFALSCVATTGKPQAAGFWKHQIGVATGGTGNAQVSSTNLCSYLDAIQAHFNDNALNQVVVYTAAPSATCVQKLAAAKPLINAQSQSLAYVTQWGSLGSGPGQFIRPLGVAVGPDGNIYVADTDNNRIQVFTPAGTLWAIWGFKGTGPGAFFSPYDIAIDPSGNIYVTDSVNRVQKFDNHNQFVTQWGSYGSGPGQFYGASGVVADGAGNVFVADGANHRIQKFTDTGTYLASWGSNGSGDGQFQYPSDLATDAAGDVYVSDFLNNRIQKFTGTGTFITKWGTSGTGDGNLSLPVGVALDASGNVYVSDSGNNRIQKFSDSGAYISQFGSTGSGDGQFNDPIGVAVDAGGNAYVTDQGNARIEVFGPSGNSTPIDRARQQLLALMLNVAANNLGLDDVISKDGATVSQAITYCDQLIDDPAGDRTLATSIGDKINSGQKVNAGVIPLGTANISYRGLALRTFHVTPNPGPGARRFVFTMPQAGRVRLTVFDVSGRLVNRLVDGSLESGAHSVLWAGATGRGSHTGTGLYFAKLETEDGSRTLKVIQLAQ